MYRSFRIQQSINGNLKRGTLTQDWKFVMDNLPNLNVFAFPINSIKCMYLVTGKQYDLARSYLDRGARDNPHLPIREYYRAKIFLETGKLDSALPYAKKAFQKQPRARGAYEQLNVISFQLKDTLIAFQTFVEYTRYREEAWAWIRYFNLRNALHPDPEWGRRWIEAALLKYPDDGELQQLRLTLEGSAGKSAYEKAFSAGNELYTQKKFNEAILDYEQAMRFKPNDYLPVENIPLCHFSMKRYETALSWISRIADADRTQDGKAEFVKAVCLLNMGKREESCKWMQRSKQKGFEQAIAQSITYCP